MRLKTTLMMLCMSLALSACHKMAIVNPQAEPGGAVTEDIHLNIIFSLYELSSAVDVKNKCGDKVFQSVTTMDSVLTVLAGFIIPASIVDLQAVKVECSR